MFLPFNEKLFQGQRQPHLLEPGRPSATATPAFGDRGRDLLEGQDPAAEV